MRFSLSRSLAAFAVLAVFMAGLQGYEWQDSLGILLIWLIHACIALVLSAPIVLLARKRVDWHAWELLAIVLPFAVWSLLIKWNDTGKTLANLAEPFAFALAIPVAAMFRAAVGKRLPQERLAGFLIAMLCLVAAAVYFVMPALPE
jgi:hypothetical protein